LASEGPVTTNLRPFPLLALCSLLTLAAPVAAQTPNTATMIVAVVDQTGAVVKDAKVTIVNAATGTSRDVVSGPEGLATVPALSVTGTDAVNVAKPGFTSEAVKDLTLRAGETATIRVKLVASGGASEVTVYGTSAGMRETPQIGRQLDSQTIDQLP